MEIIVIEQLRPIERRIQADVKQLPRQSASLKDKTINPENT